jgi:hypothetical protein
VQECLAYIGFVIYTPQQKSALSIIHVPVQLYQKWLLIHTQSPFIYNKKEIHIIVSVRDSLKKEFCLEN